MPRPIKHNVAVSYAWKEEDKGIHAGVVEDFCKSIRNAGVEIVRDIDRLKQGGCISEFMRTIGSSDFLCVFLSDAYLKSPNCMYELLVAWQRSKDNPTEFRDRVKVWVMTDASGIRKSETRLAYLEHWISEKERIEPLIAKYATGGLAPAELQSYGRIKEFAAHVNEMLCFFADTLSADSAEHFQAWIEAQFASAPPEPTADQLSSVYANVIEEIESVLNRHPNVQQFLSATTIGLVHREAGGWKLAAAVKDRRFDVCAHLQKIVKALPSFKPPFADLAALGEVAGGLVVLAVDRKWVLEQRELARAASANFPGDDESINLGGARTANVLHLATSALADGRARLEKVFGKPVLDEFRLPDAPELMRGIGEPDHEQEVKMQFIRFILGPNQAINRADPHQFDILFNRTKRIISAALNDDHTPYVASGETYKRLAGVIRDHLKVHDLLLIQPSGDDPEHLLTDYVRVLRFLGTIFDAVSPNTRNKMESGQPKP